MNTSLKMMLVASAVVSILLGGSALAANVPQVTTKQAANITSGSVTLSGKSAMGGVSGQINVWFEYGKNVNLGASAGHETIFPPMSANADFSATVTNLAPGTTYFYRAVSASAAGTGYGATLSFTTSGTPPPPSGSAPSVQTLSATGIGQSTATLNASVNPNGSNTTVWFEWGTLSSLGSSANSQSAGNGTGAVNVSASLANLAPNTTYYFRAVAQNSFGTNWGSVLSFTTHSSGSGSGSAPSVLTNSATGISQNGATLQGSVNPNNSNTNAWFEWGTSFSLGFTTGSQNVGGGSNQANLSSFISVSQNTTYYFRAVAQNAFGTTYGSILSLTTQSSNNGSGSAPSVTTNSATGISQNGATLQGSANPNGSQTNAWFEWGTSFSLGFTTNSQGMGGSFGQNSFSSFISLSPNTTYYFRAVAQNGFGTSYGSILSFTSGNSGGYGNGGAPSVTTNSSAYSGGSSVQLSGIVNPNGTDTNAWFEWGTNFSLGSTVSFQHIGLGTLGFYYSGAISGLAPNTTYYYRAVAQNAFGTSYGSILSFSTGQTGMSGNQPSVVTTGANVFSSTAVTLNGSVSSSGSGTTAWFEWGETMSLGLTVGTQSVGSPFSSVNYSYVLSGLQPGKTYYYRSAAQNGFGTSYGGILSFTTTGSNTGSLPSASTLTPSFVTQTYAVLRGLGNPHFSQATVWFEWGGTFSLGQKTSSQFLAADGNDHEFTFGLVGLSPNTTYYYRAVIQNSFGTVQGNTIAFTTKLVTVPPPSSGVSTPPPAQALPNTLALVPATDNSEPKPGDTMTYSLSYRNTSASQTLSNVTLSVTLPEGTTLVSRNPENGTVTGQTVTFQAGSLAPASEGKVEIALRISEDAKSGDTLVFMSQGTYVDASGRLQSVTAYLSVMVKASQAFLAAIFEALGGPLQWILALLFLLAVGALIYRFFAGRSQEHMN